jgi:hypothetical protein
MPAISAKKEGEEKENDYPRYKLIFCLKKHCFLTLSELLSLCHKTEEFPAPELVFLYQILFYCLGFLRFDTGESLKINVAYFFAG